MNVKYDGKAPFNKDEAEYVYILVRTDLTIAQQFVQGIHASMSATHQFGGLTDETRVSLLSVDSEDELQYWASKLEQSGIDFKMFWEPDNNIGWSSLATAPISKQQGKIFKKLNRWDAESTLLLAA